MNKKKMKKKMMKAVNKEFKNLLSVWDKSWDKAFEGLDYIERIEFMLGEKLTSTILYDIDKISNELAEIHAEISILQDKVNELFEAGELEFTEGFIEEGEEYYND